MSVVISNVSDHDDMEGLNTYIVHFSGKPVIARFDHIRSEGLAACLRRAAEAVGRALPVADPAEIDLARGGHLVARQQAVLDVLAERRRQVEEEEFTDEHDDCHDRGELSGAGAAYALNAACLLHPLNGTPIDEPPECWLWDERWWKPNMGDCPRRDLVKAAALILAEIDRIDRAAAKGGA